MNEQRMEMHQITPARRKTVYVLYCDDHGPSGYYHGTGLGIFWTCGARAGAREFTTRAAAAKLMQRNGKHRQGWRVLKDWQL